MIPLPQKPRIITQDEKHGVFEVEGLYPGYGLTLGNALRRVLLSSLPGAAATSVRITGVKHEFSTIPGVLEDVVEITLNLKQMRFRLHGDEAQRIMLAKRGTGQVTASAFTLPSQVEVINPDQHIATITDKTTSLELELLVERGLGYQPVEERKIGKLPVGEIALDAIFTPIRKVAIEIENMRVGERTDYNRLRTIIETDGTVTPQTAFQEGINILVEQFQTLKELLPSAAPSAKASVKEVVEAAESQEKTVLKNKVEELDLATRVSNSLIRAGIKTIGGLVHRTEASLLNLEGLGEGSVKEIKKELGKLGLTLKK
ncbi:MAG: DNA-directed RNA polymerase subunit alpha [bacterium]|nr:DNA-directed RNA polymerase subunit alpha [bacterium]MDZ4295988.1 DNA-directed RNA polymerase subunit alpha [Patescibacteria group bacterium]